LDRLTRHQLKENEIRTTYDEFKRYFDLHSKEIVTTAGAVIVVAALVFGYRAWSERQEAGANNELAVALRSFRAYVGPSSGEVGLESQSFPTAEAKYDRAEQQFRAVIDQYPHQRAAKIARYHVGVCQSALGDHNAAIKTLEEAAKTSDKEIAAIAKYALAGEYAAVKRVPDAVKLYQDLANHPTTSVPKATALLAEADAYRASDPAQARRIYQGLEKEFASDSSLAGMIRDQMAGLQP
jgi:tetratricopeptide (TPR) repeat protein